MRRNNPVSTPLPTHVAELWDAAKVEALIVIDDEEVYLSADGEG
jgi:hypothetical protein